ncbi:MAG: DUF1129 family protein [Senegalia sp. (in: firmicutes)]|uniref:DUF1129 family protein n=3 Tax=Senegalia sp. (in: firmicutes) TaxID=1924098 RepID=UPI003F99DF42
MMKTKELIKLNNEKREKLTDENLKYYEEVLIYIRSSLDKKEVETEEILAELLDHLLDAEENGKTAKEIFGASPTEYAKEITEELPSMNLKENILFFTPSILFLFAGVLLVNAIFTPLLNYALNIGEVKDTIYLGSIIVEGLLVILVSAIFLYLLMKSIRNPNFNIKNKVIKFLVYWLFSMLYIALFTLIFYLIPDFGYKVTIPVYIQLLLGAIFAISGFAIYKSNN